MADRIEPDGTIISDADVAAQFLGKPWVFVSGDTGVLEWELAVPDGHGGQTRTVGRDPLEFRGDLVHRKSAFQKRHT